MPGLPLDEGDAFDEVFVFAYWIPRQHDMVVGAETGDLLEVDEVGFIHIRAGADTPGCQRPPWPLRRRPARFRPMPS